MPNTVNTIVVCGAGTMGSGIAQVAAQNGLFAKLFDVKPEVLLKAKSSIEKNLHSLTEKGKIEVQAKEETIRRLEFVDDIRLCIGDMVVEAVVEKIEIKLELFEQLSGMNSSKTIFCTNTSSLSVTEIASRTANPERVCGMHFFNPATLMKLVEVVKTEYSNDETIHQVCTVATQMNKVPVVCKDSPGFIVNRVARHYYLEALKLVEEGICDFEQIDLLMEAAGFKMGPFRLMDLIGNDVNLAVTKSLYEAFDKPDRLKPSPIQEEKVRKGELGRKSGKGYYEYE